MTYRYCPRMVSMATLAKNTNMNNYLENRKKREIARVNCINYIVTLILNNNDSSSLF